MVVILTAIVLMVVGIPGYIYILSYRLKKKEETEQASPFFAMFFLQIIVSWFRCFLWKCSY